MKRHHPVVERYVAHLERAIARLDATQRREILLEIRNHIAEATAAGRPLDVVLEALGPADALGRAYCVELVLNPQHERQRHPAHRWFSAVGLMVALGIPTLVVVSTLGSIGISFVVSGLFAFIIGALEATGTLPGLHVSDLHPAVAMLSGPPLVILGVIALAALRFYARFVVRTVRAPLQAVRPTGRANLRTAESSA